MRLRQEKRKPDVLDPTAFDAVQQAMRRKVSSSKSTGSKKNKRAKVTTSSITNLKAAEAGGVKFVYDHFTDNLFTSDSKCAMCGGNRQMGIEMTQKIKSLQLLISPPEDDEKLHLQEDIDLYFKATPAVDSSVLESNADGETDVSGRCRGEMDKKGGWASIYGVDMGKVNDCFLHLACAVFSPLTWLKPQQRWCNLRSEIRRSHSFKCSICGEKGPTVGCYFSNCRHIVHVPCALARGWKPTIGNKAYYCGLHAKDIEPVSYSRQLGKDIDISRGYESLPVTMDACTCSMCRRTLMTEGLAERTGQDAGTSNSFESQTSTALIEAGIYASQHIAARHSSRPGCIRTSSVPDPLCPLMLPSKIDFLYITRNVDDEGVNSMPSKVNAITSFCQCGMDGDGTCANDICSCSQQSIINCSGNAHNTLRPQVIFECGMRCSCSIRQCSNREVGRGVQFYFHIFSIRNKYMVSMNRCIDVEHGVQCRNFIPKDSFVCEVIGQYRKSKSIEDSGGGARRIISLKRWCTANFFWDERRNACQESEDKFSYVPEDLYLDFRKYGNLSRFIRSHRRNDLLSPNLDRKIVYFDHSGLSYPHLALYASRDILPGEELVF